MKSPGLIKRVIFSVLVICILFVIVEVAARCCFPYPVGPAAVVPATLGQFNERLGWTLKPNAHATSNRTGQVVSYRINSHGLRDNETTYEKPARTYRIVVVGDSTTFGYGVPIEKHYARLLEGYFRDVEVINLGVSGYGIDQSLLRLKSEGFRYAPDMVIAYVPHYGAHRHMHTRRWGRSKPRFVLDKGHLVLTHCPVARPDESRSFRLVQRIHRTIRQYSRSYQVVVSLPVRWIGRESIERNIQQRHRDEKNLQKAQFREELFDLGEEIVCAMDSASSQRSATFILVTRMPTVWRGVIERGILAINVDAALRNPALKLPGGLGHLNESGNGALACKIAEHLRNEALIPEKHYHTRIDHQLFHRTVRYTCLHNTAGIRHPDSNFGAGGQTRDSGFKPRAFSIDATFRATSRFDSAKRLPRVIRSDALSGWLNPNRPDNSRSICPF